MHYIGIDIGGTFIKGGVVDECGKIVFKKKIKTICEYNVLLEDVSNLIKLLREKGNQEICCVGVGIPGTVDSKKGFVVYCNNLGITEKYFAEDLQKKISLPVYISNDANMATLGEYKFGAGKGYSSLIMVTLGTGIGGGIVINGKLFEGNMGLGTEIGCMSINFNGNECTCGRKGCFETYASTSALVNQTKTAMIKNKDSLLWHLCDNNIEAVNGEILFEAYLKKDVIAIEVFNKYVDYLSVGLVNLANIFRPEIIVLGGGISAVKEILTQPLQKELDKYIYAGCKFAPVKILSATMGNDAGIIGATEFAKSVYLNKAGDRQ